MFVYGEVLEKGNETRRELTITRYLRAVLVEHVSSETPC